MVKIWVILCDAVSNSYGIAEVPVMTYLDSGDLICTGTFPKNFAFPNGTDPKTLWSGSGKAVFELLQVIGTVTDESKVKNI